jgi:hypothetical protein
MTICHPAGADCHPAGAKRLSGSCVRTVDCPEGTHTRSLTARFAGTRLLRDDRVASSLTARFAGTRLLRDDTSLMTE